MPVYSSHFGDYRQLAIGRRIREHRQARGLTLSQLADKVHMSEAKLSNIENAKVSLDLSELTKLATALDVTLPAFFPRTTVLHHLVTRGHELASEAPIARDLTGAEPGPAKHHNPVWSLAELFVGKHMEPVLAQIHPLADRDLHFIAHDHEEFMFVLKGEVETMLKTNDGIVREHLSAGDSMYFRSDLPHCHRSASSQRAQTLNVIHSLRGAIDPTDAELSVEGNRYYRRGVYTDAAREASEKIALLRRSRGMTLAELSLDIGVGARQLAEIESGNKSPDVDLLLRLARRFRRPIEYFFSTALETSAFYSIQRRAEVEASPVRRRRPKSGEASVTGAMVFRPLAGGLADRGMYPYYVQIGPSDTSEVDLHAHPGEEFIYVLEGEVELSIHKGADDLSVESLHPGDALFLDSSVPHGVRGTSRNPYAATVAEIIVVFWSPLGEDFLFMDPGSDSGEGNV